MNHHAFALQLLTSPEAPLSENVLVEEHASLGTADPGDLLSCGQFDGDVLPTPCGWLGAGDEGEPCSDEHAEQGGVR